MPLFFDPPITIPVSAIVSEVSDISEAAAPCPVFQSSLQDVISELDARDAQLKRTGQYVDPRPHVAELKYPIFPFPDIHKMPKKGDRSHPVE